MNLRSVHAVILDRTLDPASSLAEILFGLIMTLTFTLGAGLLLQEQGRAAARELMIATIGCNVAWGIIDGVLYVIGQVYERNRQRRLAAEALAAPDEPAAVALIARELDELFAPVLSDGERHDLYRRIVERCRRFPIRPAGPERHDFAGALASFVLVFASSVPAALPFTLIDDPLLALRVSNALLVALLFVTGFALARRTMVNPWLAGFAVALLGVALTFVAIAFGG